MAEKKGIGIIGFGGFGIFIRKAWDQMDNARVVAVCDSIPSRDPGDIAFYEEASALLADAKVDIVSIATPPSTHKEIAIEAMRAGKHVLVEKPIALTVEDALEIKRVSEETGRVATVNFVLRYTPLAEILRELVRSEALGKLLRLDLRNYAMQEGVPEGHWFWSPEISGRILLEHGVHFFDLAAWVTGAKAGDIWSLGVDRKPGMEDRVFAAVKYDTGLVGTFWHSFSRPGPLETTSFHFAFDLGEIDMAGWIPMELGIWGWTGRDGVAMLEAILDEESVAEEMEPVKARASDRVYDVAYELHTCIEMEESKDQIYSDAVRGVMADLIAAADDPSHVMRVTIDDAIEAVRVAEAATLIAHTRG